MKTEQLIFCDYCDQFTLGSRTGIEAENRREFRCMKCNNESLFTEKQLEAFNDGRAAKQHDPQKKEIAEHVLMTIDKSFNYGEYDAHFDGVCVDFYLTSQGGRPVKQQFKISFTPRGEVIHLNFREAKTLRDILDRMLTLASEEIG